MSSVTDKNRCSAAGSVFGQFQYTKPPEPASLNAEKIFSWQAIAASSSSGFKWSRYMIGVNLILQSL